MAEEEILKDEAEVEKEEKKEKTKEEKTRAFLWELFTNSLFLLTVLVLTLLLVKYVGQRTVVIGSSMNPTLSDGDNLIVDKISFRFRDPKRFEVVVFPYQYEEKTFYIKRVIGLPGETVQIKDGTIYINEKPLSENYGAERIKSGGLASEPFVLGENEYFVMGDNRNNSKDSRDPSVAAVNKKDLVGRAWLRLFPFDKIGFVKH
jgi:signal peptidase I